MCADLPYNYGAYAEYIVVPGRIVRQNMYQIPDYIPYERAAIMEPLSTVVHGQAALGIQPGERVAIIGAGGPIGLMHLQLALLRGASQVIAVDIKEKRLQVAKELGATHVINALEQDPLEAIMDLTDGIGSDATVESAGSVDTWTTAMKAARKGGRVLWFGGLPGNASITLDSYPIHYGELTIYGVYHSTPVDVYHAYQLIVSETVNTRALISGQTPLANVERALLDMYEGKVIKMAVVPDME
jgi:L-iditol 2-dehydrogenase